MCVCIGILSTGIIAGRRYQLHQKADVVACFSRQLTVCPQRLFGATRLVLFGVVNFGDQEICEIVLSFPKKAFPPLTLSVLQSVQLCLSDFRDTGQHHF